MYLNESELETLGYLVQYQPLILVKVGLLFLLHMDMVEAINLLLEPHHFLVRQLQVVAQTFDLLGEVVDVFLLVIIFHQ
jgi:hypothetical protein